MAGFGVECHGRRGRAARVGAGRVTTWRSRTREAWRGVARYGGASWDTTRQTGHGWARQGYAQKVKARQARLDQIRWDSVRSRMAVAA